MPPPTPPPASQRREPVQRRDNAVRGPWASEAPDSKATDAWAGASQLFGALLGQARSQGQGGGGRQSDRGRSTAAPPKRGAGDRRAQAEAVQALLVARCAVGLGPDDGAFELLLPGGTSLGVQHRERQGALHLSLSTDDAMLAPLLRRESTGLAARLTQQTSKLVTVQVA
jgi:hypothetical protein